MLMKPWLISDLRRILFLHASFQFQSFVSVNAQHQPWVQLENRYVKLICYLPRNEFFVPSGVVGRFQHHWMRLEFRVYHLLHQHQDCSPRFVFPGGY